MAWQLLAAALPAAAKVAGTALSKPRQEDYAPQTDYMKKYLSYIRGRSSDREVMHQAMQPALRVAGKQGRQMQRQVGYDVAKSGLGGSGIEAQMRLSAGQQTQEALATATDKAVAAQTAETARIGQQAAGITAQIGAEEARAEQAFKTAESNWKKQMASDILGGAASLASAGISQYGQNIEGFNQAKTAGVIGADVTYDQFKSQAKTGVLPGVSELGLSDRQLENLSPASYAQYLGANEQLVSDLRISSRYLGGDSGVKKLMEQGYKPEQIARMGREANQLFSNNFGKVDDATLSRALGFATGGNVGLNDIIKSIDGGGSPTIDNTVKSESKTKSTIKDDQVNKVKQIRTVSRKNPDGSESTVLMSQRDNFAYPTLFPKDPANPSSDPADWIELEGDAAFEEAKKRGEVFQFSSESEAMAFAEGNWKGIQSNKIKNKNYRQGKGLTAAANNQLYAEEPDMRGKPPEERVKRYEELFINNNIASL